PGEIRLSGEQDRPDAAVRSPAAPIDREAREIRDGAAASALSGASSLEQAAVRGAQGDRHDPAQAPGRDEGPGGTGRRHDADLRTGDAGPLAQAANRVGGRARTLGRPPPAIADDAGAGSRLNSAPARWIHSQREAARGRKCPAVTMDRAEVP